MDANDSQTAKQLMSDWISSAESCNIEEYKYCAKTLLNWQTGILNSFDIPFLPKSVTTRLRYLNVTLRIP